MALGNLASRFLVALVAAPILILAMYQSRAEFTWVLVFGATLVAMHEFFAMTLEDSRDRLASMLCGAATALAIYWLPETGKPLLAYIAPTAGMFLAIVPIAIYYLFRFGDMQTVGRRFAFSVCGIVYCAVLFTFVALIKRDFADPTTHAGGDMILFVLLVAWLGDTGAYFAGRFLGKRKLYEAVSPKKTWAGAIGGICASAAGGVGVKLGLMPEMGWFDVFAMAVPGAILGQMGDLVESLFKRSTGVKDSGSLLPGHGGILDRIDAVLFLAPYVYLYWFIQAAI